MNYYSRRLFRNCFPLLVLAASCNILLASGLEKRSVEYRRNRSANAVRHSQIERRVASSSNNNNNNNRKQRTRGSRGRRQSRRQLGKDGGKDGGSSSGSGGGSSSSSGGGGSSETGSTQKSTVGYDSDDGSYCGCLCVYDNLNFKTHDVTCDYAVDQNSYGIGHSDPEPDNSESVQPSYFQYNRYVKWTAVPEPTFDYFQNYDNAVEGKNDAVDDQYQGDDGQGGAEVVTVEQLSDEYNPYAAFDIGKCATYSHLWTYDLFLSCAEGDVNCGCQYAVELIDRNLLTCSDIDKCPSECSVCSNCLHSVCDQFLPTSLVASGLNSSAGFTLAAAITTVVLAAWVAHKRKRKSQKGGILGESLMDADGIPYKAKDWSIRIGKDGLPTEQNSKKLKKTQVWLAPDVSTIPKRKAMFPDLLQKGGKTKNKKSAVELSASKKRSSSKRRQLAPVIVTSSNVSIPSSLSSCGGNDDDDLSGNVVNI